MKKYVKWISIFVMFICVVMLTESKVHATEVTQDDTLGSISIDYTYNDDPLDDVTFSVYKIASIIGPADFVTTDKFQAIDVDYEQIEEAEYLLQLRGNLENYINLEMITPDQEFVTDTLGQYSLENLDLGLYIIIADNVIVGEELLLSEPILIMVGSYGQPDDKWLYHFDISAKLGVLSEFDDPDITVKKVWANVNSALLKPEEIEVELYRDGELYDTVILNDENAWSYTWENMDFLSSWAVVETTELEYYVVDYSKDMFDFVITNTYAGVMSEELPQTSSLALPVVIFSSLGMASILLGILIRPKEDEMEDEEII